MTVEIEQKRNQTRTLKDPSERLGNESQISLANKGFHNQIGPKIFHYLPNTPPNTKVKSKNTT